MCKMVLSSKDKQQAEKVVIEKNIVIDASPEVVFKAITDQDELTNWFPDQAIFRSQDRRKSEVQLLQR